LLVASNVSQFANASLYSYDSSPLTPTWTSVSNAVMFDTDNDNYVDTVYSSTTLTANSATLTKQFGTGKSSFSTGTVATGSGSTVYLAVLKGKTLGFGGSGSGQCAISGASTGTGTNGVIDIISGTITTFQSTSAGGGSSGDTTFLNAYAAPPVLYNGTKYLNFVQARSGCGSGAGYTNTLKANTTTIQTTSTASGQSQIGNSATYQGRLYTEYNKFSKYYTAGSYTSNGGLLYNSTLDNTIKQQATQTYYSNFPYNVWAVSNGILRVGNFASFNTQYNPTWAALLTNQTNNISSDDRLYFLHYKLLNTALTSDVARIKMKISGVENIGLTDGSTLYYTPVANLLNNKAVQLYLVDSYAPTILSTSLSTALPTQSIRTAGSTGTYDTSTAGIVGLTSGFVLSTQTTTARSFTPAYSDSIYIMPSIIPPTTSLTATTITIKNAPTDAIYKLEEMTYSFNSTPYQFANGVLDGTKSFTADFPSNYCLNVSVADGSQKVKVWTSLGSVCGSGTMPKTLTYSQNLAFTFWSLPWGASSTYDSTTQAVSTVVRHDTKPYTYYVKITDVNGTVKTNTKYTVSLDTIDTRSIATNTIGKPAKLEILDDTNQTMYFSTLGYPSSLSNVASFFAQYFTLSGFNLLAMLPLVFAAMFTRNTVSIGTVLTVVLIATMGWFGLIAIPEVILYLMIFVAIIGMVAYKVLF